MTACAVVQRLVIVMRPPPTFGDRPCLIEFSTSGCRIMLGTMTSSVSGWMRFSTRSCGPKRTHSMSQVLVDRLDLFAQRDEVIRGCAAAGGAGPTAS